ncbi:hypothetical protein VaNZ11_000700, partial [Volvox africanus]
TKTKLHNVIAQIHRRGCIAQLSLFRQCKGVHKLRYPGKPSIIAMDAGTLEAMFEHMFIRSAGSIGNPLRFCRGLGLDDSNDGIPAQSPPSFPRGKETDRPRASARFRSLNPRQGGPTARQTWPLSDIVNSSCHLGLLADLITREWPAKGDLGSSPADVDVVVALRPLPGAKTQIASAAHHGGSDDGQAHAVQGYRLRPGRGPQGPKDPWTPFQHQLHGHGHEGPGYGARHRALRRLQLQALHYARVSREAVIPRAA